MDGCASRAPGLPARGVAAPRRRRHRPLAVALAAAGAAAVALVAPVTALADTSSTGFPVAMFSGGHANAINHHRQAVVGTQRFSGIGTNHISSFGLDPGPAGSYAEEAVALNNVGQAAGFFDNAFNFVLPSRWNAKGRFFALPLLPNGTTGAAFGINDFGVSVGYSNGAHNTQNCPGQGGLYHAVTWAKDGSATDLGTGFPNDGYSIASGSNTRGIVVGMVSDCVSISHAAKWSPNGRLTYLGALVPGGTSEASSINSEGKIAGWSTGSDGFTHPVMWDRTGRINDLSAGCSTCGDGHALAINDLGQVVGWEHFDNSTFVPDAFAWGPALRGLTNLGTFPGNSFSEARGIDDEGNVVGVSYAGGGPENAVSWTIPTRPSV